MPFCLTVEITFSENFASRSTIKNRCGLSNPQASRSCSTIPKGEVLQEEFFSGAKDADDPAEQMSKAHLHQ